MTNAREAVITVRGLQKTYGETRAVDGIDLDVLRGEVFALLGPNGAGKTTTVEILEGYRKRDKGDVSVLGTDPGRAGAAWRERVGVVQQEAMDAGELSVREIVRHFARYYPDARDPDDVIDLVGLTEKAKERIVKLSGGQRRRLDVALGILGRPELVFLDEPTTGFDPEARRNFWELIKTLTLEGATIVLTTHYLDEAEALADRVGVIARGRIVALDTPAELGGRDTAQARLCWQENGVEQERVTDEPTGVVLELARKFDGEVPGLIVHRPTLEDIYLQLVGGEKR